MVKIHFWPNCVVQISILSVFVQMFVRSCVYHKCMYKILGQKHYSKSFLAYRGYWWKIRSSGYFKEAVIFDFLSSFQKLTLSSVTFYILRVVINYEIAQCVGRRDTLYLCPPKCTIKWLKIGNIETPDTWNLHHIHIYNIPLCLILTGYINQKKKCI